MREFRKENPEVRMSPPNQRKAMGVTSYKGNFSMLQSHDSKDGFQRPFGLATRAQTPMKDVIMNEFGRAAAHH